MAEQQNNATFAEVRRDPSLLSTLSKVDFILYVRWLIDNGDAAGLEAARAAGFISSADVLRGPFSHHIMLARDHRLFEWLEEKRDLSKEQYASLHKRTTGTVEGFARETELHPPDYIFRSLRTNRQT
jgi:hypothetical protein